MTLYYLWWLIRSLQAPHDFKQPWLCNLSLPIAGGIKREETAAPKDRPKARMTFHWSSRGGTCPKKMSPDTQKSLPLQISIQRSKMPKYDCFDMLSQRFTLDYSSEVVNCHPWALGWFITCHKAMSDQCNNGRFKTTERHEIYQIRDVCVQWSILHVFT